jgi:hypothetical protein
MSDLKEMTVGAAALELSKKTDIYDPTEIEREANKCYEANLIECAERGAKKHDGDFYVVVITKQERLLPNVIRRYFLDRKSCPTSEYDQSVFKYVKDKGQLQYLWTVPDIHACRDLLANEHQLSPELYPLLAMVKQFEKGELDKLAVRENQEEVKL